MRCKCCDRQLKSAEIIWYPEQQRHEDLCSKCRGKIFQDFLDNEWDVEKLGMYTGDIMEVTDE